MVPAVTDPADAQERLVDRPGPDRDDDPDDHWAYLRHPVERGRGTRALGGNRLTLLRNGVEIFPALWQALDEAQQSIDVVCFEMGGDGTARELTDKLLAALRRGCQVRLLTDPFGGRRFKGDWIDEIRDAGGQVRRHHLRYWWRPATQNHRFHGRAVVCDGRVAFTGGFGIADRWRGDAGGPDEYRDYAVRVVGPAVCVLSAGFMSAWASNGGVEPPPCERWPTLDGPDLVVAVRATSGPVWNDMATVVDVLTQTARSSIRMAVGYFSPPPRTVEMLCAAARRGVDVQIVTPGPISHRDVTKWAGSSRFDELLDAGVRLYRYLPARLHAKAMVFDGVAGFVGSANLNSRSLGLDGELGLLFGSPELVRRLDADLDRDVDASDEVLPGSWARFGAPEKAFYRACRVVEPWV
jgi:cardiolipin synthase